MGCPTEILSFSDRAAEFQEIGCEVVGASVDSHFTHLAWVNTPRKEGGLGGALKIPLLADLGGNVDEVLRLVKAFKFTDEHGEVCPVNWTPGANTMKPNPKESKEYFEKVNA